MRYLCFCEVVCFLFFLCTCEHYKKGENKILIFSLFSLCTVIAKRFSFVKNATETTNFNLKKNHTFTFLTKIIHSIVIGGSLTRCTLLHCDLKAAEMNVQHSLIRELIFYKFKLGSNAWQTAKNICCVKGKDTVDHSSVTR